MMKQWFHLFFLYVIVNAEFRAFDGSNNNPNQPLWGTPGIPFVRGVFNGQNYTKFVTYLGDGQTPNVTGLLSPREISNIVVDLKGNNAPWDERQVSLLHMFWGQFLDHDLTLTPTGNEFFNISIPNGDPVFGGYETTMPFTRSTGVMVDNLRIQTNGITSFIDGSSIYGSSNQVNQYLRDGTTCKMKVNSTVLGDLLPLDTYNYMGNDGNSLGKVPGNTLFLAGDIRANENPVLTCFHTVFVREHNRLCDKFKDIIPDEEERFQTARKWVIAFLQHITFDEYVVSTLGEPLESWTAYNSSIDPTVDSFFATAGFRYGHTEIASNIPLYDPKTSVKVGDLPIIENFFNPTYISGNGIEQLLSGIGRTLQNKIDPYYVQDLRNFLFGRNPANTSESNVQYGTDLAARNIQRGRDHGIPRYNDMREYFGLGRKQSFSEVTSDPELANALSQAYPGGVDTIDPYIGGLAEDSFFPSHLGELFTTSVREQYLRVRDGDRFYYENVGVSGFTAQEIVEIKGTKLADIILRNTNITRIQCSTFFVANQISSLNCGQNNPPSILSGLLGDKNASIIYEEIGVDKIRITISAKHTGWIGFGIPESQSTPRMLGTDAAIGFIDKSNNQGSVFDFKIGNTQQAYVCPAGVCTDTDPSVGGRNDLEDVSISYSNSYTTMMFTRKRDTGDTKGDRPFAPKGQTQVVLLALGNIDNNNNNLLYHESYKTFVKLGVGNDGPLYSEYTYNMNLDSLLPGTTVFWTPNVDSVDFALSANIQGWVGLGFTGGSGKMKGSNAAIGWGGSSPSIESYYLGGYSLSTIEKGNMSITNTNITQTDSQTILKFTVAYDGVYVTNDKTEIIASYCVGCYALMKHTNRIQNSVVIDLSSPSTIYWPMIYTHGLFMFIGMGVAYPIGFITARYGRFLFSGEKWFLIHLLTQMFGTISALIGLVVAIVNLGGFSFSTYHSPLGLSLVCLSVSQVIAGFLRPKLTANNPTLQRTIFEVLHHFNGKFILVGAVANIYLGLHLVDANSTIVILYSVVIGIAAMVVVSLEISKKRRNSKYTPLEEETPLHKNS
eukprot:TRINITY_DN3159_c0_g1_i1.p1 TRINITY_DN3159_c0_g1~~TRINITY_DN3159_c0_g1_i1.p1  ORF type:complete len:1062 (+),score=228.76 TRINITY_DN3159_c0_g1_i1:36-3221(+)